jgi:hypothetical protein
MTIDRINPIGYSYAISDVFIHTKINRSKQAETQNANYYSASIKTNNLNSNFSSNQEIFYIHNPVLRGSKSFKAALREAVKEILKEELSKKENNSKESVSFKSDFEKIKNLPNGKYVSLSFNDELNSNALKEPSNSIKNMFLVENKLTTGRLVNLIV